MLSTNDTTRTPRALHMREKRAYSADRFNQLAQSALGSSSSVLMDQVFRYGLVEPFGGDTEFRLGFVAVSVSDGFANTTQLGSHAASQGTVVLTLFVVLTEPFLGTRCVWHVVK